MATHAQIRLWLASLCALVLAMIVLGGVTRLTGSGLSIVEWNPILGAIPPLNDADWAAAFARYREYPQYRLLNPGMTLSGFKQIYYWEYLHRLVARLIGLAFVVPWLWLHLRGRVDGALSRKLAVALGLGGAQGALGWLMVKSGLVDQPQVSPYRLAAHLLLALGVLCYLFWIYLGLSAPRARGPSRLLLALTALVGLQIVFGALVAGLKAGYAYEIAPDLLALEPQALVQFIHRLLGWSVFTGSLVTAARLRAARPIAALAAAQFALGVGTLLLHVPIPLAVLHQLGAAVVLLACVRALHREART